MGQGVSGHRLNTAGGQNNSDVQNKFADREEWPSKLEEGKQGKHIRGHNNYQPGKSYLTISMEEAKTLVERYSGTGQPVSQDESNRKERVDFGQTIGYVKDRNTGEETETTWGTIHHSAKGTHIVPCNPPQRG